PLLLARAIDPRDPLHLLMALGRVALLVDVDAIAAEILRDVARDVGRAHDAADVLGICVDRHDADADADLQRAVPPYEAEARNRLAQLVRDVDRALHRAVAYQHGELIAAEPRDHVLGANP